MSGGKVIRKSFLTLKALFPVRRNNPMRLEQEVFEDLRALCCLPGFVHAMADICFRHNMIWCAGEMKASDMAHLFSYSRLIRTETTTLIGLMIRAPIRLLCPPKNVVASYALSAEQLLEELHQAMNHSAASDLAKHIHAGQNVEESEPGIRLREAIFYGGESAYLFQYRDLALERYRSDAEWLLNNKGIDIEFAGKLSGCINELLDERLLQVRRQVGSERTNQHSLLPGFVISCAELADRTNASLEAVRAVIEVFTLPADERNAAFNSLDAFNQAYAYPFISVGDDKFLSLQHYGLPQALYDVPFYWMNQDEAYVSIAAEHRGEFTEGFAFERLSKVFGANNVFRNVKLPRSKGKTIGEIDVLALFGDRAIVVQAKSKKLTIEARKGNDPKLREDFQKAVQDAVDQAFECSEALMDPTVTLRCGGKAIKRKMRLEKIYPIALVAEHYPALAAQVRQYLQARPTKRIAAPLVIDVFALDAITEFLSLPLRLISYLKLRARFGENFRAHHEHTILSYHLRYNLLPEDENYLEVLHDDFSSHLELAMTVRREGMPGADTPEGILTRARGKPYARLLDQLENKQNPNFIALGLFLLEFSEETVQEINRRLPKIMALTSADGHFHDFTIVGKQSTGLTVHCSRLDSRKAEEFLVEQCRKQKDSHRAERWFGLAIRSDGSILWARKWIGA